MGAIMLSGFISTFFSGGWLLAVFILIWHVPYALVYLKYSTKAKRELRGFILRHYFLWYWQTDYGLLSEALDPNEINNIQVIFRKWRTYFIIIMVGCVLLNEILHRIL